MKTIRKPKLTEIADIKRLLDNAAEGGSVLRRPLMELYENVRDFYTYADEQGVGGCCALHIDTVDLAEIRSLVVRPDLRGTGIGEMLLKACLDEARSLHIDCVYCLTRNPEFFGKHGFVQVEKQALPHKVFNDCVRCSLFPDCDEIAMTCSLVSTPDSESSADEDSKGKLAGTLGFLGFGNMGGAILRGLLGSGTISADKAYIYDVSPGKLAEAEALGVNVAASSEDLAKIVDTLLLAVKPQMMAEALEPVKRGITAKTRIVTIAAGISINYIQEILGKDIRVVRVMPNTPAMVNAGAAGIALSSNCSEADAKAARTIFEAVGVVEMVDESLIDAVTALSGSGPAYFFYTVECLAEAAVKHGLSPKQAANLAAQTLLGSGRLLKESGEPASVLREKVTSKGGTTFAALEAFRAGGLASILADGVDAAAARSKELGK
jgi:pyrroline-5-carboxylate reductase